MMGRISSLFAVAVTALLATGVAHATVLTFDDLTAGSAVGNYGGLTFSPGADVVADPTATSAPNVVASPFGSPGFFSFEAPDPFTLIGLWAFAPIQGQFSVTGYLSSGPIQGQVGPLTQDASLGPTYFNIAALNWGPIELVIIDGGLDSWVDDIEVQVSATSVPEPSTLGLIGLGLLGLGAMRRRRSPS